ncbi:ArsR/SmtB family transcription factor [Echinimonas agarilytica]|uniref:Metalloregulator ArsR/SmtB family transcription factor n=1 Tax=Echinimonas agarilytica TaxID=1215918 RepID=A0AA41W7W8_9GAMM|nr:metalloregulator ArsR/SmtB family transcription factor [Echinimonas agarilytica]MCM2680599.1 metalloregulator ArsR/SmtB family transcription factor [Echinimonas agarilytica]
MNLQQMQRNASQAIPLLKALSNQNRLFILCHLHGTELSVTELTERVGLSQSALSQHLAILRSEGYVKTRKEAQTVYYSLDSEEVAAMIGLLHDLYCKE